MVSAASARLYVLLAREASTALIFRRGPSAWVQMILWDTKRDLFTSGQWLHGRIYPERCDLSPDGKHVVYFAGKFSKKSLADGKVAWTAISKPPYFTALDIHFQSDTWGGGGLFSNPDQVWFYHRNDINWWPQSLPSPSGNLTSTQLTKADFPYTYPERMQLYWNGWREIGQTGSASMPRLIWHKTRGGYGLTYTETAWSKKQAYAKHYQLKSDKDETELTLEGIPWADFDQQGRLILAKEGRLFSAALRDTELKLTELADFNSNQPEQIETPDWAKKW